VNRSETVATVAQLLQRAWELAYLDPPVARSAALHALDASASGSLDAAWAQWHLALADVRTGAPESALRHHARALAAFRQHGCTRGEALCGEIEAIAARREGDLQRAQKLQQAIDACADKAFTDFDRFVAFNSRAITAKLLGETELALSSFYEALASAEASGNAGARVTALGNLGGYHQDLFNFDDARKLCQQALDAARKSGARAMVTVAAANLIVIHHAERQPAKSLEMARYLTEHPQEQLPGALKLVTLQMALAYLANGELERAQSWLSSGAAAQVADGTGLMFWAWLCGRVHLALGEAAAARELAERTLAAPTGKPGTPYDQMELLCVAMDACEKVGDPSAALAHGKRAHSLYRELVGRSARARMRALQASHEFVNVQRQLEAAQRCHIEAETDRRRLADLNRALEAKVAETELLHAQMREQVLRDPLTSLYNRRYLFEVGPGLLELTRRNGQTLCVALLDLDHFKSLNDTHGHAAGDAMLQFFASMLQSQLRRSDVLCRYGGEEFVIVMPDVDMRDGLLTVERVLGEFLAERVEFRRDALPQGTFSAGVAAFPDHGDQLEVLLARADKALYRAKAAGRSRVERAQLSGFAQLN
jgi:diguanylate cyclase (GGDEF)-like protein